MNKYIAMLYCLFCACIYGQDQQETLSSNSKIEQLKEKLNKEEQEIQEIRRYLEELEGIDDITPESIHHFPKRIKNALFPESKKTVLDQLQELRDKINGHEKQLDQQKGLINITFIQGHNVQTTKGHEHKVIIKDIEKRTLSFVKQEKKSLLRIIYNDNFRVRNGTVILGMKIYKQDQQQYQSIRQTFNFNHVENIYRVSTLFTYVEGVEAGPHTLQVYMHIPKNKQTSVTIGENTTFTLQVEEIAASKITIQDSPGTIYKK